MKVLLAIASDRFMDEAYTIPKQALEAAGVECVTAAPVKGTCYKFAAAICLAPVILGEAGLLNGKKATTLQTPACIRVLQLDNAEIVSDNVVVDGNIITAKSPFDAKAFADAILSKIQ